MRERKWACLAHVLAIVLMPTAAWAHDCSSLESCMNTAGFHAVVGIITALLLPWLSLFGGAVEVPEVPAVKAHQPGPDGKPSPNEQPQHDGEPAQVPAADPPPNPLLPILVLGAGGVVLGVFFWPVYPEAPLWGGIIGTGMGIAATLAEYFGGPTRTLRK